MIVLLGMAAAVLDVGSWYKEDRELQATMDAAALAGAQALPDDTAEASALAEQYSTTNGGGLDETEIDDEDHGRRSRSPAPARLQVSSKVIGIDSVTVNATAARVGVLANARYAAPIAVDEQHPYLQAKRWGEETTLELDTLGPGAYRLLNIDGSFGGTNPATLGDWIRDGYDDYMPLGDYYSDQARSTTRTRTSSPRSRTSSSRDRSSSSPCTGRSTSRVPASSTRSSAGSGSW